MKYYFIAEYLGSEFHIPNIFSVEADSEIEAQKIIRKILTENYHLEETPEEDYKYFIYDLDYNRNAFVSYPITEDKIPDIQQYHEKHKSGGY